MSTLANWPSTFSSQSHAALVSHLLDWFDGHQRQLPWRQTRDPYAIWVSEVMLQQTTVAAVIKYFNRFIATFPTVQALAAADEQDVLRVWEGLGYYRRAKHLHAAAKQLVAEHNGQLPDDPTIWSELPGVGRYILGAVLSQAFERKLPIVEANSLRVLARWFGYPGDPRTGLGHKWVWRAAENLLPDTRIGDYNQALMELGATICSPTQPACGRCPVKTWCRAGQDGTHTQIPPAKAAVTLTAVREVAVCIRDAQDQMLLCQRPDDAPRWANLWEFPHGEISDTEPLEDAAVRIARELTGIHVDVEGAITTVTHGVTRYRITMTAMRCRRMGKSFRSKFYVAGEWLTGRQLVDRPTSTAQRRLFRAVGEGRLFD